MPTIYMAATGRNINTLRKAACMTVIDLQLRIRFNTPQAIFKLQRGDNLPTIDNLVILAVLFNVKLDDIIVVNHADEEFWA